MRTTPDLTRPTAAHTGPSWLPPGVGPDTDQSIGRCDSGFGRHGVAWLRRKGVTLAAMRCPVHDKPLRQTTRRLDGRWAVASPEWVLRCARAAHRQAADERAARLASGEHVDLAAAAGRVIRSPRSRNAVLVQAVLPHPQVRTRRIVVAFCLLADVRTYGTRWAYDPDDILVERFQVHEGDLLRLFPGWGTTDRAAFAGADDHRDKIMVARRRVAEAEARLSRARTLAEQTARGGVDIDGYGRQRDQWVGELRDRERILDALLMTNRAARA